MDPTDNSLESAPDTTADASTTTTFDAGDAVSRLSLSRRGTLIGLAGLAGLGLVADEVTAQQGRGRSEGRQGGGTRSWRNDVDADGNRLFDLGALSMAANPIDITDFAGTNLDIDSNGVLNATGTAARTNVSDNGTQVVADVEDVDFAQGLTVSDDGDGSVTVSTSWEDTDADGLLETPDADGIDVDIVETPRVGTTDATAFEGVVNDQRFLRAEPAANSGAAPNIVGGYRGNKAESSTAGATIAGGGGTDTGFTGGPNVAGGDFATVSGGTGNTASGNRATVGGGRRNTASQVEATVSGGLGNVASGGFATVGGGITNSATASEATIGGGSENKALGRGATVPGGFRNLASGEFSFATGYNAVTQDRDRNVHDGAVVFGDSTRTIAYSNGPDTFTSQMPMYAPAFNQTSARSTKEGFAPVDTAAVLDAVTDLELSTWRYKHNGGATHMGPMAEEFYAAFELGDDDEHIATVDADGVALAAIQGLAMELDAKGDRINSLEAENTTLRNRLTAVEDQLAVLESRTTTAT